MKKALLYIYLIFLVLLTVNLFTQPEPEEPVLPDLEFSASNDSFVLPKTPVFHIKNNTERVIDFDNCKDGNIDIRDENGRYIFLGEEHCEDFAVEPGKVEAVFGHTESQRDILQRDMLGGADRGSFVFTFVYKDDETDLRVPREITIKKPGAIRSFFRTIFYRPIYNFFVFLIEIFPGYSLGLAIIAITIVIRIILLVPQQRIMVSQRKMQTLQPRIKAIQEQYKNDQAQLGMKIMELYKKEKVNPFGAFVPLFIQIPILIVLYWTILGINDSANHYHLYNIEFLQAFRDITINSNFIGMDLLASGGVVGLGLAIVVGVAQFIQMKLSQINNKKKGSEKKPEKKKPKNPNEPEMPDMQKVGQMMVYFLPIMIAFFTYQFPAGVGLYWLVGTIFMTFQQLVVNKLLADKEKQPKVVDASGKQVN